MDFNTTKATFNRTDTGQPFDQAWIDAVWQKGTVVLGYDGTQFRRDVCGAWMQRDQYGITNSKLGWEVDHIFPKARGGRSFLQNLQPLQWENNRAKADEYPQRTCRITGN